MSDESNTAAAKSDDNHYTSILDYMTHDHQRCDELYAEGEAAALEGNAELATKLMNEFNLNMTRHLDLEEKIIFPAFTDATGMSGGPVQVMLMEHEQMRGVLTQMKAAVDANDLDTVTGLGETMLILMQQHNMKEEGILYPMIDSHLPDQIEDLIRQAQSFKAA